MGGDRCCAGAEVERGGRGEEVRVMTRVGLEGVGGPGVRVLGWAANRGGRRPGEGGVGPVVVDVVVEDVGLGRGAPGGPGGDPSWE